MPARDRVAVLLVDYQRDFNTRLMKAASLNLDGTVTIPRTYVEVLTKYFDHLSNTEFKRWQNRADTVIEAMLSPELRDIEGRRWDYTMLRELRDKLGITQKELATRLGVSVTTVARWERGESTVPGAVRQIVYMICGAGVDIPAKKG